MITFKPTEYYRCEYCNKLYLMKSACIKHEQRCKQNPDNCDACLKGCSHLEATEELYYIECCINGDYDEKEHKAVGFNCNKHNKLMYPYTAVYKDLPNKYPETFESKERMPTECDDFNLRYF